MKNILLGLIITIIFVVQSKANILVEDLQEYDVLVYGATSSGITSAIQASRMGKNVILLEPSSHAGGINIEGLGGTDIDNHPEFQNSLAVGGLALEFYRRVSEKYDRLSEFDDSFINKLKRPDLWRFEPHIAEEVIIQWLKENSVTVIYNSRLKETPLAVEKEGNKIVRLTFEDGVQYSAKVFIDATIEGDLLKSAGVSYVIGRESNSLYNENRNGIRESTTHNQFKVAVDPFKIEGDVNSGLIPTIQDESFGVPGSQDSRLQAYCFRVCLTKDSSNQIPFAKPDHYDRNNYEIYIRYIEAGGKLYVPKINIPNDKTDLNGGADLSHNLYGMNYTYPDGSYSERERVYDYHKNFTQGLFYFLSNDFELGNLAPDLQNEWKKWGLAKDEFQDNDGWPRQFYVRDARRMVSDYIITEHHAAKNGAIPVEDPIAIAFWPPDVHSVRRIAVDGKAYNEGFVFGGDWWKPFGLGYRSITPKLSECNNLLAPSTPSSSHIAYGAIRIEWTFMSLGQAAGTAASIAIDENSNVQDINYQVLKFHLENDGQILSLKL